jgi:hypothetical protein
MAQVTALRTREPSGAEKGEPVRQSKSFCGICTRRAILPIYLPTACGGLGLVVALWCCALANLTPVAAAQQSPTTFSDAVQVLAREQSAAEQYATILIKFGNKDDAVYRKGIALYAEAKADFDGLIEALKADLILGREGPPSTRSLQAGAQWRPDSNGPFR